MIFRNRTTQVYATGFPELDRHGLRLNARLHADRRPIRVWQIIFLRQLLINLWRLHGWRFLLSSFEEKVKPRFERDLRRHLLERLRQRGPSRTFLTLTPRSIEAAFFCGASATRLLDADRLIDRIEFAVRVYGIRVAAIDPMNEIEHQIPKSMSKQTILAG